MGKDEVRKLLLSYLVLAGKSFQKSIPVDVYASGIIGVAGEGLLDAFFDCLDCELVADRLPAARPECLDHDVGVDEYPRLCHTRRAPYSSKGEENECSANRSTSCVRVAPIALAALRADR